MINLFKRHKLRFSRLKIWILVILISFVIVFSRIKQDETTSPRVVERSMEPSLEDWSDEAESSNLLTEYNNRTPLVYLTSFPRSGSKWIRNLIDCSSGIGTEIFHDVIRETVKGYIAPSEHNNTTYAKTGGSLLRTERDPMVGFWNISRNDSVILLIRNPLKAILSLWNMHGDQKLGLKQFSSSSYSKQNHSNQGFSEIFKKKLTIWEEMNEDVILSAKNILVVFYEEMTANPMGELKKLFKYLGLQESAIKMTCLRNGIKEYTKRDSLLKMTEYDLEQNMAAAYALSSIIALLNLRGISVPDSYTSLIQNFTNLYPIREDKIVPKSSPNSK